MPPRCPENICTVKRTDACRQNAVVVRAPKRAEPCAASLSTMPGDSRKVRAGARNAECFAMGEERGARRVGNVSHENGDSSDNQALPHFLRRSITAYKTGGNPDQEHSGPDTRPVQSWWCRVTSGPRSSPGRAIRLLRVEKCYGARIQVVIGPRRQHNDPSLRRIGTSVSSGQDHSPHLPERAPGSLLFRA
jgi:hypothetical protein